MLAKKEKKVKKYEKYFMYFLILDISPHNKINVIYKN